jgi:hypothetical protein
MLHRRKTAQEATLNAAMSLDISNPAYSLLRTECPPGTRFGGEQRELVRTVASTFEKSKHFIVVIVRRTYTFVQRVAATSVLIKG